MAVAEDLRNVDALQASDQPPVEYIVDEASDEVLRLHLDKFEGPFEVLLYLIRSQEIDVFDIPISKITTQYLRFLDLLREERLDVAGDFLVMAATLLQIKSRMLLPVDIEEDDEEVEEEDPRIELVEKLIEYRKFKDVAARLELLEAERQNWFERHVKPQVEPEEDEEEFIEVSLFDLVESFRGMLRFITDDLSHTIAGEHHSVDEKIAFIEEQLAAHQSVSWRDLFKGCVTKVELVCCFLAILELCRMGRIRAHQHRTFEEIRIFAAEQSAAV